MKLPFDRDIKSSFYDEIGMLAPSDPRLFTMFKRGYLAAMNKYYEERIDGKPELNDGLVLLPCPFCGGSVTMGKNREHARIIYFQVECECGAIAGSAYALERLATDNWNRRASVKLRGE